MILEISNVLVSSDIITEQFCCDWTSARASAVWKAMPEHP